jgi:energy-coupling factor transporter ATP-binding protein EcfA2
MVGWRRQPRLSFRLVPKTFAGTNFGSLREHFLYRHGKLLSRQERRLPSPSMHDDLIYIATRHQWGHPEPCLFGLRTVDRRQHVYVIGKTGSGKSTLLRNMIIQHVTLGHGVGLIDSHGDLAEDVLAHIPPHRADDLVYFNPADLDHPIGLNVLARVPSDERHLVASGIIAAFKSLWRESWGPRLEYILHMTVSALLECENVTLLAIPRMLGDASYRQWVLRQVKDPFIRAFWTQEYERYDERFRREAIAPIQNKVGQFLTAPIIRNIIGQVRTKVNLRFMMDEHRLFIANLAKGKIGEDKANLLGSLLVAQFHLAAMSRSAQLENDRQDFFLFIDEFQNFTTDAFASILSEARKYRLCLTLSHQYTQQLPLEMQQALFGNVGTLVSFRVGYSDATVLAAEYSSVFPKEVFVGLPRFEIVVQHIENGEPREPFRAAALAPLKLKTRSPEALAARSRQKYSAPRRQIEDRLYRWMRPR